MSMHTPAALCKKKTILACSFKPCKMEVKEQLLLHNARFPLTSSDLICCSCYKRYACPFLFSCFKWTWMVAGWSCLHFPWGYAKVDRYVNKDKDERLAIEVTETLKPLCCGSDCPAFDGTSRLLHPISLLYQIGSIWKPPGSRKLTFNLMLKQNGTNIKTKRKFALNFGFVLCKVGGLLHRWILLQGAQFCFFSSLAFCFLCRIEELPMQQTGTGHSN